MEKVYLQSGLLSKVNGINDRNNGSMCALGVCGAFFMGIVEIPFGAACLHKIEVGGVDGN